MANGTQREVVRVRRKLATDPKLRKRVRVVQEKAAKRRGDPVTGSTDEEIGATSAVRNQPTQRGLRKVRGRAGEIDKILRQQRK